VLARRLGRFLGVLAVAAAVVVADRAGLFGRGPTADRRAYDGLTFTCVRVLDGDTLDVDRPDGKFETTRVRLWGVDTPELGRDDRPPGHFADQAADFTRSFAEGKSVTLRLEPHQAARGKHGRLLAYVILPDGRMLNQLLVETGHAYADPRYDHYLRDDMLADQGRARAKRLGLWANVDPDDLPYYWQGKLRPLNSSP